MTSDGSRCRRWSGGSSGRDGARRIPLPGEDLTGTMARREWATLPVHFRERTDMATVITGTIIGSGKSRPFKDARPSTYRPLHLVGQRPCPPSASRPATERRHGRLTCFRCKSRRGKLKETKGGDAPRQRRLFHFNLSGYAGLPTRIVSLPRFLELRMK